jgi:hypothetical protein
VRCARKDASDQVDVNVEKVNDAVAVSNGFTVRFDGGSLTLPFRLAMCHRNCPPSVTKWSPVRERS